MPKEKAFVCLGRNGDIINALPLAYEEYKLTGKPVDWVVSCEFAKILDGCSYVVPRILEIPYDRLGQAMGELGQNACPHKQLVRAQAWGTDISVKHLNKSFCTDVWGFSGLPYGSRLPVFDKRDIHAEQQLIDKYIKPEMPTVLVNTSGVSGKFKYGDSLIAMVKERMPQCNVVNLSDVRSSHMYDLLGLYEKAQSLITIDTATLHLAAATPLLATIALIPDRINPWCTAPYRKGNVLRVLYSEHEQRIDEICRYALGTFAPRIHHVWCDWREAFNIGDAQRIAMARNTWKEEYKNGDWVDREFKECQALRTSASTIGDNRKLPYIRDMIDSVESPNGDDIICITNSDIAFVPGLTGWITENCARNGATWAQRWDHFDPIQKPLINEHECGRLSWYDGADLFAFTVAWWKENREQYPNMILGCESWDAALRQLIKKTGGVETHQAIYHQRHDSFWYQPGNREHNRGNIHNRTLNREWLNRNPQFPWMDMRKPK